MIMNNMLRFVKQLSGRLSPSMYTSMAHQTDPASIAFLRQMQRDAKAQDVLKVPFSELKVTVFDLETTGFYPQNGDRILSVGAVTQGGLDHLAGAVGSTPVQKLLPDVPDRDDVVGDDLGVHARDLGLAPDEEALQAERARSFLGSVGSKIIQRPSRGS